MKKILYDMHEFLLEEIKTIKENKRKDELKEGRKYTNNEYFFKWTRHNAKKFEKQWRKKHGIKK